MTLHIVSKSDNTAFCEYPMSKVKEVRQYVDVELTSTKHTYKAIVVTFVDDYYEETRFPQEDWYVEIVND